jgi:hypothetical protein
MWEQNTKKQAVTVGWYENAGFVKQPFNFSTVGVVRTSEVNFLFTESALLGAERKVTPEVRAIDVKRKPDY